MILTILSVFLSTAHAESTWRCYESETQALCLGWSINSPVEQHGEIRERASVDSRWETSALLNWYGEASGWSRINAILPVKVGQAVELKMCPQLKMKTKNGQLEVKDATEECVLKNGFYAEVKLGDALKPSWEQQGR